MRGLNIDGHAIMPIRAVSYASGGDISPLSIVLAVGDRRPFHLREFATPITGYWLDAQLTARPMLAAEFEPILEHIGRLASAGASIEEQIGALPAGVFFHHDAVAVLVQEINALRREYPPSLPERPPVQLSDWPHLNAEQERLALEGFEPLLAMGRSETMERGVRAERHAEVERVMGDLTRRAADQGIAFDRSRMPGRVAHLIALLKRNSGLLTSLSDDVVRKDYLNAAGIHFLPGRRAKVDLVHPIYLLL